MSYIGNKPATSFETVQKQISTSNSGTTITLDRAVTSVQDILLTIDAVVQSYDNYSVSGTTLTVGGTLNNNRVEILYVGRTMQSVDPTDNSVSTAKVQNDAITVDKLNLISTSSVPSLEAKGDGSSVAGKIKLNCHVNSHGVTLQSPDHSSSQSWTLKLPDNSPTADKFLKVKSITGSGSTATGQLEFADASGTWVRLGGTDATGLSDITYDLFSATYKVYKIIGTHSMGSNSTELRFRVRKSGSDQTGSNYRYIVNLAQRTSSSGSTGDFSGWDDDHARFTHGSSYSASHPTSMEINVFAPFDSTRQTSLMFQTTYYKPSEGTWNRASGGAWIDGSAGNDNTGIKIYGASGTIDNADYSIYGLKES